MNIRKLIISAAALIVLGTATLVSIRFGSQTVKAFSPQPDPPAFGLVGITNGQTIEISVVNTRQVRSSQRGLHQRHQRATGTNQEPAGATCAAAK